MVVCPRGYKKVNATHCQDINECQLQGVCPHGDCLNTPGSYRCTCEPGFVPASSHTACVPENLLIEEKGPCYRLVSAGKQCMHPLSVQLSKQMCCCSVGKAWGTICEKCPILGTAAFKQICPGGMGYHVSQTFKKVTVKPRPDVKIHRVPDSANYRPVIKHSGPIPTPAQVPPEQPLEAFSSFQTPQPEIIIPEVGTTAPEQELEEKQVAESSLPQLSPSISTIQIASDFPEVVEKNSPPSPVHIAPEASASSLTHFIASTQVAEINECSVSPQICGPGQCINLPEGYTCNCDSGFHLNTLQTACVDVDECAQALQPCSNGHCKNTEGSFRCICRQGFTLNGGTQCTDINECLRRNICGAGHCINAEGSYRCQYCDAGYRMNSGQCEDVDECQDSNTCQSGRCINSPGSYECVSCPEGYTGRNGQCIDINECFSMSVCSNGECSNLEGGYICTCNRGYEPSIYGKSCKDIDECQDAMLCTNGQCSNREGSFHCECKAGHRLAASGDQCEDIDECQENADACQGGECMNTEGSFVCVCRSGFQLVDDVRCQDVDECLAPERCVHGDCLNTEGSFHCICEQGFTASADGRECDDVNECTSDAICNGHGFCENTVGSFRCLCDQGYQDLLDGRGCVDVNECEMISGVCAAALCENVEGSFLCFCADEIQEFDPTTGECHFPRPSGLPQEEEKKECYYNLNDAHFCDNVLTSNVTKQECCCTLGAGWGDNCEVFPCPMFGSPDFSTICPEGKGLIPNGNSAYGISGLHYRDANECVLFGEEICKNGACMNTEPGYECYCRQGLYYDPVKLHCLDIDECQDATNCVNGQCINTEGSYNCFCTHPLVVDTSGKRCTHPLDSDDIDECQDPSNCIDGQCVNTDGSYNCFCIYPLILDSSGKRCIQSPHTVEQIGEEDICWQVVNGQFMCDSPLVGRRTTYTECCCLFGEAWGMDCALCPMRATGDYAQLCNLPINSRWHEYGRDALKPFQPDYPVSEPEYDSEKPFSEHLPLFVDEGYPLESFEGLQAEECGILNGCENGRCVRVQEGYTCDCYDGYQLDITRLECVDVNECTELNDKMSLCRNAKCINTDGSYKCECLPGYAASEQPNYCITSETEKESKLE